MILVNSRMLLLTFGFKLKDPKILIFFYKFLISKRLNIFNFNKTNPIKCIKFLIELILQNLIHI